MSTLFRTKSIAALIAASDHPSHRLKKTLGLGSLIALGIGVVVGSGIFTLTGTAASATLNQANAISNLGSFAATDGDFLLADGGLAGSFTVSGPVTGSNVTISGATALNVTGAIGSPGNAVAVL